MWNASECGPSSWPIQPWTLGSPRVLDRRLPTICINSQIELATTLRHGPWELGAMIDLELGKQHLVYTFALSNICELAVSCLLAW